MNTKNRRSRQHLKDTSHIKEENSDCDFINALKAEENSREISAQEMAATMAGAVRTSESLHTNPENMMCSSDNPSPEVTMPSSKTSLSYIALIAKVILSSPSQKLNLASIYKAMEEHFPYLKRRGPGWRNSVRHNLSVNDCFVKVSRCENGRGHYWGVHEAHLRDFQQGDFRQCRKARGRRGRERSNDVAGCLAWMETSCSLAKLNKSKSLGRMEPQCPLQEQRRYLLRSLDWTQPVYQPWNINVCWVQSPSNFPVRIPDLNGTVGAGRVQDSQPMTSRPTCWEMSDPVLTAMKESYDSRFMTPAVQALRFPGCWCMSPEFIKTS